MEKEFRLSRTRVFDLAGRKLERLITKHPDQFPMYTQSGSWHFEGETWTNWCEGFLGGELWLMYLHTRNNFWREKAEHYCRLIKPREHDRSVHDLGFLFWPTWKRWYDITGEKKIEETVIEAGKTMAKRFQEKGQYLHSFLGKESIFIDIMMNIEIIFYAAEQTGNQNLWNVARAHADTTRKYLVRGDGSTAHEGIFDLKTGEFLRQTTQQGWRNDSCWSRGLAWAIYGFGTTYKYTRDGRDLATAEACAQYYVEHTPAHGIPPNDWDEPIPEIPYESSAAAITASGLWQLAELVTDTTKQYYYRDYSKRIISTLATSDFLAKEEDWEGLLKHGIYHQRKNLGVDESVMWGDYFFLESIYRIMQNDGL